MVKGCYPHRFFPCILFLHHLKPRTSKVWKKWSILLFHRLPHTHHKKTVLPLASQKFISFSTSPIQVKPHIPLLLPIWCLYTNLILLNHMYPSPTLSSLIYSATWSPLFLLYPLFSTQLNSFLLTNSSLPTLRPYSYSPLVNLCSPVYPHTPYSPFFIVRTATSYFHLPNSITT